MNNIRNCASEIVNAEVIYVWEKYYMEYFWIESVCQTPMEMHGVMNMKSVPAWQNQID